MSHQLSLFETQHKEISESTTAVSLFVGIMAYEAKINEPPKRSYDLYKLYREVQEVIKANNEARAREILDFLLTNSEYGVKIGHQRRPAVQRFYEQGCAILGREPQ